MLRAWMQRTGHTKQRDVANLFGVHESYVSLLLNFDKAPGRNLAVKIERLTGIPVRAWISSSLDESGLVPVHSGKSHNVYRK